LERELEVFEITQSEAIGAACRAEIPVGCGKRERWSLGQIEKESLDPLFNCLDVAPYVLDLDLGKQNFGILSDVFEDAVQDFNAH